MRILALAMKNGKLPKMQYNLLNGCQLTDECAAGLGQGITVYSSLKVLYLNYNDFSVKGIKLIFKRANLETLDSLHVSLTLPRDEMKEIAPKGCVVETDPEDLRIRYMWDFKQ